MSVKELKFNDGITNIEIKNEADWICFYTQDKEYLTGFRLDCNQAHLLMLYLQEHLK